MTERDKYLEYFVQNETNIRNFNSVKMVSAFGSNVARLRASAGFTQKELSKMTGINESTLVRIELGNIKRISMFDAMKLCNFFHMPLILMCGEGNDLMSQYSNLIRSSARTQRLVNGILEADIASRESQGEFDSNDMITRITFGCPIKDGINTTRFLYEQDNISLFRNYPWYSDAMALLEINSTYYHPLLTMGDKCVIVDRPPNDGELGVYIKENCLYIRRLIEKDGKCEYRTIYTESSTINEHIIDRRKNSDIDNAIKFGTIVAVI